MRLDYTAIASVLDAVADYVDGIEYEKTAAEESARQVRISKLAERYEMSTGEGIPGSLRDKLAGLDQEALDHLVKLANNTGDSPESLGNPADRLGDVHPTTTKEAADLQDTRFLNWIIND